MTAAAAPRRRIPWRCRKRTAGSSASARKSATNTQVSTRRETQTIQIATARPSRTAATESDGAGPEEDDTFGMHGHSLSARPRPRAKRMLSDACR